MRGPQSVWPKRVTQMRLHLDLTAPQFSAKRTPQLFIFFSNELTAMAPNPRLRRRPEEDSPGATVGQLRCQTVGQPTGYPVGPFPASQLAGIRPPKNHAITPRFAPLVTSTSPFWSPFVVRGRHGDKDLIPTPDEVAICIPKSPFVPKPRTTCCAYLIG